MSENSFQEETFRSEFNGKTVLRILSLLKPYPLWIVGFLVSISINSVTDSTQWYLTKMLTDDVIIAGSLEQFSQTLRIFICVLIAQTASVFGLIYFAGVLGEKIICDTRKRLFAHLQDLALSYYSVTPVGWIMSRVNQDTYRICDLITWGIIDSAYAILSICTSMFFMLKINVKMALIVLCMLPFLIWAAWEFRRRILDQYRIVRKINSKITGAFNENFTGVKVVKAFRREDKNLRSFSGLTESLYTSAYKAAALNSLFLPTIQVIASFAMAAVVRYSGPRVATGVLTVGGIQAFINYIFSMLFPIQDLARVYGEMQQSIAAAERVFSLSDTKAAIRDREETEEISDLRGNIDFDDVSFYYDDGDGRNVLTDFDLHVRQGETIALVGPTGGGKSTIVNLLCRFYEPKQGVIRIRNIDYTKLQLHDIQSRVGIVLQTPHLFSGTIRENIRYGKLDATDEEIETAARTAGAYEFIKDMPNGFDEQVGECGNHLSVGQKQLISLARAILTDPDIFIMDEATSSVDTMTENLIQHGMQQIMEGRTSFIIAHRLSTIRNADRILVIENGQIMEQGTHRELLKERGKYYNLYTRQFREEKEKEYAAR